jgi:bifunctional non-homologous end joining protein LigD
MILKFLVKCLSEELENLTKVKLKNLNKILYPDIGVTKAKVIEFYVKLAPKMLPIIADRPLVLTRYPDGVNGGPRFYEKNAPQGKPDWVKTVQIYSPTSKRDIDYIVCNDLDTLIWLANLAALEIHMPFSKIDALDKPDFLFFDVDPEPPATLGDAAEVALLLREKLINLGFNPFIKTSGKKGLHVLVPISTEHTFDQVRAFVHKVGIDVAKSSDLIVSEFKDTKKPGKVFVDYLQNSPGRTMVVPYSLRATPDATVSTPLEWREVNNRLNPNGFTIANVADRKVAPWDKIFEKKVELKL